MNKTQNDKGADIIFEGQPLVSYFLYQALSTTFTISHNSGNQPVLLISVLKTINTALLMLWHFKENLIKSKPENQSDVQAKF